MVENEAKDDHVVAQGLAQMGPHDLWTFGVGGYLNMEIVGPQHHAGPRAFVLEDPLHVLGHGPFADATSPEWIGLELGPLAKEPSILLSCHQGAGRTPVLVILGLCLKAGQKFMDMFRPGPQLRFGQRGDDAWTYH